MHQCYPYISITYCQNHVLIRNFFSGFCEGVKKTLMFVENV